MYPQLEFGLTYFTKQTRYNYSQSLVSLKFSVYNCGNSSSKSNKYYCPNKPHTNYMCWLCYLYNDVVSSMWDNLLSMLVFCLHWCTRNSFYRLINPSWYFYYFLLSDKVEFSLPESNVIQTFIIVLGILL